MKTDRRTFLRGTALAVGSTLIAVPDFAHSLIDNHMQTKEPIKSEMVREFVIAGHGNLVKVKELLDQEPNVLNATWDWGAGDFETAIGGAGHMGNTEIAEFLLAEGARADIFCAAMLGQLDVVKFLLQAYPNLKSSKGPHGLTLMHHARQGKERSKNLLDYLIEVGAS